MPEFHIRRETEDGVSGYVARALALGESVGIEGPHGEACWCADHPGPVIAVAGGSGLAPMKSIVEAALEARHPGPICLFFGVRTVRDLYLGAHFEALAAAHPRFRFVPVLSEPAGAGVYCTGLVGDIAASEAPLADAKAYIAGPPVMVEHALAALAAKGVAPDDIHADPFYSEAEMVARGLRG